MSSSNSSSAGPTSNEHLVMDEDEQQQRASPALMHHSGGAGQKINFRGWMVDQVSSGKYRDLEWIDEDQTVFKLPWTKKHYPYWEEHHEIFKAWARFRARVRNDPKIADMPLTALKSNFRTVLNKCSEIEQMKDYHQLNLQTGNYKVYKVLSPYERDAKRKKKRKMTFDVIEISTDANMEGVDIMNHEQQPDKQQWALSTRTENMNNLFDDPQHNSNQQQHMEQGYNNKQAQVVEIVQDGLVGIGVKPAKIAKTNLEISHRHHHHHHHHQQQTTQSTQTEQQTAQQQYTSGVQQAEIIHDGPCVEVETTNAVVTADRNSSNNRGGFHMLLEAAEIAGSPTKRRAQRLPHHRIYHHQQQHQQQQQTQSTTTITTATITTANQLLQNQATTFVTRNVDLFTIVDLLSIPRELVDKYRIVTSYNKTVVDERVLDNMREGYRISYLQEGALNVQRLPAPPSGLGGVELQSDDQLSLLNGEGRCLFTYRDFLVDWLSHVQTTTNPAPAVDCVIPLGGAPARLTVTPLAALEMSRMALEYVAAMATPHSVVSDEHKVALLLRKLATSCT